MLHFNLRDFPWTGNANGEQDKLKEELKNIIDDLNDNLNSMKQQVAQQAKQINQLQHEKDALGQRLEDMQAQAASNKQLKDNIAKLQQQLKCEFFSSQHFASLQSTCVFPWLKRFHGTFSLFYICRNSFQNM